MAGEDMSPWLMPWGQPVFKRRPPGRKAWRCYERPPMSQQGPEMTSTRPPRQARGGDAAAPAREEGARPSGPASSAGNAAAAGEKERSDLERDLGRVEGGRRWLRRLGIVLLI